MSGSAVVVSTLLALAMMAGTARCEPAGGTVGKALALPARSSHAPEMIYYIYDWGDGIWTPSGRVTGDTGMDLAHVWQEPGEYPARWMAMSLSGRGSEWHPSPLSITGEGPAPTREFLPFTKASAGTKTIRPAGEEKIASIPDVTNWRSPGAESPLVRNWLALNFDSPRGIGWVVLNRHPSEAFPEFFSVEYSMDGGKRWHPVMSAVFPFFPDPGSNSVWIPLHGVMADSVRIVIPRGNLLSDGKFGAALGGFHAVAGDKPVFSTSSDAVASGLWSNLWTNYGVAANEVLARNNPWMQTERPLDGGGLGIPSSEWFFWNASKIAWLPGHPEAKALREQIRDIPVGADGYVWPSGGGEKHLGHSRHTVTNAIYPMAVAKVFLQSRDRGFLDLRDRNSGETVLAKARRGMDYLIKTLGGESGLITNSEKDIDGTAGSMGDNYWDAWLFGGTSAYNNMFFYESLRWMAELEKALGNDSEAAAFQALRPLVKTRFNETFWDESKGRYIGWIDAAGVPHDFGFTFVNLPAIAWGLADEQRAKMIFEWLDGRRKVEGDTSMGADIYSFGFAPRTNTLDASTASPPMVNTWNGGLDFKPGGNAAYGLQVQNGGAVFFVSFYDLMARLRTGGIGLAMARMRGILEEAAKDEIRRDPANMRGHSDIVGILREFPESGLVPLFFLDGILGLEPVADGLRIRPALPQGWKDASVREYSYAGMPLRISAEVGLTTPALSKDGEVTQVRVPSDGDWLLTPEGKIQPGTKR